MPNTKSAIKRLRQSQKRAQRNKQVKENISYLKHQIKKAISAADIKLASTLYLKLQKAVDKAAQKGIIKKNTAARIKSKTVKKVKVKSLNSSQG